jgi:SAM-dependent methyltransferase
MTATTSLWRRHSDAVNARLLPGPSRNGHLTRVLKTDLFEEAVGEGLVPLLVDVADEVHAIDVDAATIESASARCGAVLHAARADVRSLPYPDGHFDAIVSTSTLDHFGGFEDLRAGLRELDRVLRPGGELVVTLDNLANPVVRLRNALPFPLLRRLGLVPYFVGATCGPRRLREELAALGLVVEDERVVLHCPRVPAIHAARVLERRNGRARGERFLRFLMGMERLGRLPTRNLTGYYVAVRARKA